MKSIFVYMNVVLAKNRTLYNYILNLKEDQNVPKSRSRVLRVGVWMLSHKYPRNTHTGFCVPYKYSSARSVPYKFCRQNPVQNQFLPFFLGMSVSVEDDRP